MPCDGCSPMTPRFSLDGEPKRRFQVVLLGGARVGKTAIISQFLYDKELQSYKPTVEELHRGEFEIEGETLILDLLDTSGTHQFPAMRELAIKQSDAVVLVYAINDTESWEMLKMLKDEVVKLRGENVPIVVVGNKSDLEEERKVNKAVAETIVCLDWGNAWLESNAFSSASVLDVFKAVLLQGKVRYRLSPAVERRRKSLPAYTQKQKHDKFFLKRHSCNVS
ncbi:UNVERIFIED_CONTAM: hypothetical protein RMT77_004567 [Armadillidium vulgare]